MESNSKKDLVTHPL